MTYSERLHAPWTWWLVGLGFEVCIAVAVLAYLPLPAGITVCALFLVAVIAGILAYGGIVVRVDESGLNVGRYRLESRYIAAAEPYEGEAAREALGPAADPRAFLFTRPFITDVVRIDLDDLADPHPYWLVSTRRPKDLAAALRALPAKEVTVR